MNRRILTGVLAGLTALAGCMPHIVYKPSSVVSEKQLFPLRVAVQPFKDGTEDPPASKKFLIPAIFIRSVDHWNAARSMGSHPALLPPELWAKSLSTELRHQKLFTDVQYGQAAGEPAPDIVIEGTLNKAEIENRVIMLVIFPIYVTGRQDYALSLRALRAGDRKLIWSGKVERSIPKLQSTSGEPTAAVMQSMLVEATQEMVKGLQANPLSGMTTSETASGGTSESVEDILKRIAR